MDIVVQSAPPVSSGIGAKAADQQVFNASGTWSKPSGFGAKAMVLIQTWAGGGGASRGAVNVANGGAGGAYKERWILLSSLGATETVTVGAAGVGRTVSTGVGTNGGNTTFGSWVTAYAGAGGPTAGGIAGGGDNYSIGGNTTGSAIVFEGGVGGSVSASGAGGALWGGGGGGAGATAWLTAGISQFGGNGGVGSNTTTATAGTAPGGGGGANGTANTDGKDGAAGKCIVTVFDGA